MQFRFGSSARLMVATVVAASFACPLAWSDTPPSPDPVVAKVNGQPIHLSEVQEAAQGLPENAQRIPQQTLFPMLLEQLIDSRALAAEARRTGLDKDPGVQQQLSAAEDRTLGSAMLRKEVGPEITDDAVRARYQKEIAGKPGEEEVHARHILVADEATAKKIIDALNKGGDFVALSKQYNKDPGAAQQGGDLGFFKKGDMAPPFAAAAFALQPGQFSKTPVHTQFGWHVIQVLARRRAEPPSYEQASAELRQKMIREGVQKAVAQARAGVQVETFNPDGSPRRATDHAEPPPAK